MERVCFTLQVRPDRLDEYRERHAGVWPDMQQALRGTGWHNYSLLLRADGLLIGYLETDDFAKARSDLALRDISAAWHEMSALFEPLDGALPDEAMVPLPEVFHLG